MGGGGTLSLILSPIFFLVSDVDPMDLFYLPPSLHIADLCIEFFLTGVLISIFLSLFFKKNKLRIVIYPPFTFLISSIIFPIFVNLFYLFHSLLLSYLLTFLLISLSFALSLFKEIKYEKS